MKRLMLISDRYPLDLTDGKHLRVFHLSRELCKEFECYFVGLSEGQDPAIDRRILPFCDLAAFDERVRRRIPWWQRFRLSDARYVSISSPEYVEKSVRRLADLAVRWKIDGVVTFEPRLAEIVIPLALPRILDFPDCATLALRRRLRNSNRRFSLAERLGLQIKRIRARARERYFLRNFTRTVTISNQDRAALLASSGVADSKVIVIPNGVSFETFQSGGDGNLRTRSIVFWGNLNFPPNRTAVNYFYEHVFLPYLRDSDIEWHIVGAGADDRISAMSTHKNIVVAGFQEDLAGYMSRMGAMINPMVEGGGLKNKVLEAFAMELPVVSTSLGAEAIACVADRDFLSADSPDQFAKCTLALLDDRKLAHRLTRNAKQLVMDRYSWGAVARQYGAAVNEVLGDA